LSTIITGSSNSATSRSNADREAAERGGEGGFEMRPDAAVDKKLGEYGADPAWHRRVDRVQHAGLSG
jgi:hypothetical protein